MDRARSLVVMVTPVASTRTASRLWWHRLPAQCRFLGHHAERFAMASEILANRDSKSFENQVYAATHRMRQHFTALDSHKIVAELRERLATENKKLTLPDQNAQRLAMLAQAIRAVAGKGAYGEGKLQNVADNAKHMTFQDFEADGLWLRSDLAGDDHEVDVLQDFLRRAGTKGVITTLQTRTDDTEPWTSLEPIEIIVGRLRGPFDTVALEITVSGDHWTTKLQQLGKDLEILAITEVIGQHVLCIMFLNVDEATALDAANKVQTVLCKLDRQHPLAMSTLMCVFSPFRNLYGKVDELALQMEQMHSEMCALKAEIKSEMHSEMHSLKADIHLMREALVKLVSKFEMM